MTDYSQICLDLLVSKPDKAAKLAAPFSGRFKQGML